MLNSTNKIINGMQSAECMTMKLESLLKYNSMNVNKDFYSINCNYWIKIIEIQFEFYNNYIFSFLFEFCCYFRTDSWININW